MQFLDFFDELINGPRLSGDHIEIAWLKAEVAELKESREGWKNLLVEVIKAHRDKRPIPVEVFELMLGMTRKDDAQEKGNNRHGE